MILNISVARLLAVFALCAATAQGSSNHRTRPNILLAISDDQSWPLAGAYGTLAMETAAFNRVAREGVLFHRAFAASPSDGPSRAALLTGRYPWQLAEAGTQTSAFPTNYPVFTDLLEAAGYSVGYTGKGWSPGNWMVSGRTRNPAGPEFNRRKLASVPSGISDIDYAGNFKEFLTRKPREKPFCFWYGSHEPHRSFGQDAEWLADKNLGDILVPPFLPDTSEVRNDLFHYYREIEHFDRQLFKILEILEEADELRHTLVVVTSDNGMPFPKAKPNLYDAGTRVPLAIRWPAQIPGGRFSEDFFNLVNLAPTLLEAAGIEPPASMTGESYWPSLLTAQSGVIDPAMDHVILARERHESARINNLGYPSRAIRTADFLYIRNFSPNRWPSGSPTAEDGESLGFYEIEDSPSKDALIALRHVQPYRRLYQLAVAKRPSEELYDVRLDPGSLTNLVYDARFVKTRGRLRAQLEGFLSRMGDPRLHGQGQAFEEYPHYGLIRQF